MKENGTTIRDMVEGMKGIQMETYTKGNLSLEKLMEKVVINGSQVKKYTMENGQRE